MTYERDDWFPRGIRRRALSGRVSGPAGVLTDQAGRAHHPLSEAPHRTVGGLLRLAPALGTLAEEELPGSGVGVGQPLDADPDEPDPGPVEAQRVVEAPRGGVEVLGHVGGLA